MSATEALARLERKIQADMDAMERHSTSIATGLYRALRFVQMERNAIGGDDS